MYVFDESILDAPRNLQIHPRQSTYKPGDRIQCSAESNPEPSYQWTDLINQIIGAVLVITVDMVGKDHRFQCTATNVYNGVKHDRSIVFEFAVRNETSMLSYSNSSMSFFYHTQAAR